MCRYNFNAPAFPAPLFDVPPPRPKNDIAFLLNSPAPAVPASVSETPVSMPSRAATATPREMQRPTPNEPAMIRAAESLAALSELTASPPKPKRRVRGGRVPCDMCAHTFGDAAALRKHVRAVHLKEKPFACSICHRCFAERSNLKKHVIARHGGPREHRCKQCPKTFSFSDGLRRHVNNTHLGLRPHKCNKCSSAFKQRTHLVKHRQAVHGETVPNRGGAPLGKMIPPPATLAW